MSQRATGPPSNPPAIRPKVAKAMTDRTGTYEARRLDFRAPGDRSAVTAGERDAAGHQAIARVSAEP